MGHLRNEIILDTNQFFLLSGLCMDFVTYIKTSNRGIDLKDDKETVDFMEYVDFFSDFEI